VPSDITDILIIGAGGHAKVAVDVARAAGFRPVGLLDPEPPQPVVLGVPVLGGDDVAPRLFAEGHRAAIVAIGQNALRRRLNLRLREIGFALPSLVHPSALISPSATLGEGVVVMPGAIVNACAVIGNFAIVNSGAIVEHDCWVGEASHIAPRSVMGGGCTIGDEVLFGIGAVARPLSSIGARAVVGAGAVVAGTIEGGTTVVGIPARSRAGQHKERVSHP
jgi:UDP-perosamine 4-acetyltransferase